MKVRLQFYEDTHSEIGNQIILLRWAKNTAAQPYTLLSRLACSDLVDKLKILQLLQLVGHPAALNHVGRTQN